MPFLIQLPAPPSPVPPHPPARPRKPTAPQQAIPKPPSKARPHPCPHTSILPQQIPQASSYSRSNSTSDQLRPQPDGNFPRPIPRQFPIPILPQPHGIRQPFIFNPAFRSRPRRIQPPRLPNLRIVLPRRRFPRHTAFAFRFQHGFAVANYPKQQRLIRRQERLPTAQRANQPGIFDRPRLGQIGQVFCRSAEITRFIDFPQAARIRRTFHRRPPPASPGHAAFW